MIKAVAAAAIAAATESFWPQRARPTRRGRAGDTRGRGASPRDNEGRQIGCGGGDRADTPERGRYGLGVMEEAERQGRMKSDGCDGSGQSPEGERATVILWEGAKGGGGGGGYLTWAALLWARQGRRKPARGEEVLREAGAFMPATLQ